jgi:hypothetical protein
MYYEERIVNGVLSWRTTPDGCWTQFTAKGLTNELCHPVRQAAPDLLAALEETLDAFDRDANHQPSTEEAGAIIDRALKAIAKAKGVQA